VYSKKFGPLSVRIALSLRIGRARKISCQNQRLKLNQSRTCETQVYMFAAPLGKSLVIDRNINIL